MVGAMGRSPGYEEDDQAFPASAYRVRGCPGVAWRALGWETKPDQDTEWSGYEVRTGLVLCYMVGDYDSRFSYGPDELDPLAREEYCGSCGQLGCTHDGYDREGTG